MAVPRYTNDASHSRFYVFRHKTVDGVPVNETFSETGWNSVFAMAKLYTAQFAADIDAENFANTGRKYNDGFTYCVGKVFIEVDGYFEIKVF
jgi:hypothetical protein